MSELVLPAIFSDGLVLQRGRSNPIWGWDAPGQEISLSLEGTASAPVASTVAAGDGSFRLQCPELPVGGPYRLRLRGSSERVLQGVLVGEVWLASGQSNMEWKVALTRDAEREIAEANWPAIRMFSVEHQVAREPQRMVGGMWRAAQSSTVHDFSAVGYFFARELHRALGVPVGIIDASWGGTPVEAWTSVEALQSLIDVDGELRPWALSAEETERIRVDYQRALVRWE